MKSTVWIVDKSSQRLKELHSKFGDAIIPFQSDEINHKNIAYETGATNKGLYSIMDKFIRTGSRIAITISEKI